MGWREALRWLVAILAVLTALPRVLVLRRRPSDLGLEPDGAAGGSGLASGVTRGAGKPAISIAAREAVRSRTFRWLAAGFALSAFTTTAVSVHLGGDPARATRRARFVSRRRT